MAATATSLDPRAVLDAMGWRGAQGIERVTGGWDNQIWRFRTPEGTEHALRLYRAGPDPAAVARTAEREATALRAALESGLPVPLNHAVGLFEGRPAFIQEWMPGRWLLHGIERHPWALPALGREFGRVQARLHRVWTEGVPALPSDEWVRGRPLPRLAAALRDRASYDTFCHFDYQPLNVLGDGHHITAVLDFTGAAVADRRADLAITETAILWGPMPLGPRGPLVPLARRIFHRAWRAGYAAEAGDFPLDTVFRAFGLLRLLREMQFAIQDGRDWARADQMGPVRRQLARQLRAAGLRG
jgi:aminoglycoside phosphotransferase (APT) family kinase protein